MVIKIKVPNKWITNRESSHNCNNITKTFFLMPNDKPKNIFWIGLSYFVLSNKYVLKITFLNDEEKQVRMTFLYLYLWYVFSLYLKHQDWQVTVISFHNKMLLWVNYYSFFFFFRILLFRLVQLLLFQEGLEKGN